ncbi:kinase-like protein [Daldinia decipiens]|uniref:kinase-like protein n=1 Tax=Daldinia decipiens TaxID=326647 RepID=UPI0020C2730B|nr:kinase-like protein [Daldinia decipiens]KAI1656543.1 kinase-like protein [Daldinia decipiens]
MAQIPPIPESFTGIPWNAGMSGGVFHISDSAVIKKPISDDLCREQLRIEGQIYQRLKSHPYITKLLAIHEKGIVLERLQYPLRQRLLDLQKDRQQPTPREVTRWALQVAEALRYIHSCGVKQVDIGTYNVLLDWDENAKLSDFAGSSLDGSEPTLAPSVHSTHPRLSIMQPSVQSELFAFGSLLYEVETTYKPYHDKNEGDIEDLFEADEYPDTSEMILGDVIKKCWMTQYSNASEVVADIRVIQNLLGAPSYNPLTHDHIN